MMLTNEENFFMEMDKDLTELTNVMRKNVFFITGRENKLAVMKIPSKLPKGKLAEFRQNWESNLTLLRGFKPSQEETDLLSANEIALLQFDFITKKIELMHSKLTKLIDTSLLRSGSQNAQIFCSRHYDYFEYLKNVESYDDDRRDLARLVNATTTLLTQLNVWCACTKSE